MHPESPAWDIMRVNLTACSCSPHNATRASVDLSVMIRPTCGLPGDYVYPTDSKALLAILLETDLPGTVLARFKLDLLAGKKARLLGVNLSERSLTKIGYFID